ncbi:MAG TPA: hypothetical protein VIJ23_10950 [Mycobacterium sp.]
MPSISPLIIHVIDSVEHTPRRTRRGRKPARTRFATRVRRS